MIAYQKPLENNGPSSFAEEEAEMWNNLAAKPLARLRYIISKCQSHQSNLSLKGSVVVTSALYQIFIALHLPDTW